MNRELSRDAIRYLSAITDVLQRFGDPDSLQAIDDVSKLISRALWDGQQVHLFDNGHFLGNEFLQRAGGVPFLHCLRGEEVRDPAIVRSRDVLIIASVSGRSTAVVEMAMLARERGVHLVALTSLTQARGAPAEHPSGKRLHELADVTLDIGGVQGDGLLDFPGISHRFGPASGIASAVLLWMVLAQVVGNLLAAGLQPTVFPSVNVPGGAEAFQEALAAFQRRGV